MKTVPISAIALIAMVVPVNAQTIPSTYFRDAKNNIYLMGQTPNAEATITYANLLKSRTIQSDNCGRVIWKTTATNPVPAAYSATGEEGTFYSTSLPLGEITRCNPDGQAANNGTSGTYRTAAGDLVISSRPPNTPVQLFYKAQKTRKVRVNLCGFARWSSTAASPHTGETRFLRNSSEAYVTGLEERVPPLCSQGNLLIPASWLGGSGGGGGS
jgi:hypothetical protein